MQGNGITHWPDWPFFGYLLFNAFDTLEESNSEPRKMYLDVIGTIIYNEKMKKSVQNE